MKGCKEEKNADRLGGQTAMEKVQCVATAAATAVSEVVMVAANEYDDKLVGRRSQKGGIRASEF